VTVIRKKYDRAKVDWQRASCRGLNTDFFYMEESQLYERQMTQKTIRKMCFDCPIQKACMEIGFEYEEFGIWGGFNPLERLAIRYKRFEHQNLNHFFRDAEEFGYTPKEILGERYTESN
jgi:hypothetical protein